MPIHQSRYFRLPYKARIILKENLEIIKEIRILEGNLIEMTKLETKLLKKEKKTA